MRCTLCGEETYNDENTCSACKEKLNQIQVLSPEERENFNGLTIEQGFAGKNDSDSTHYHSHQRVYTFNSSNAGILTKLILGAIFLLLIIVALPIAIIIMALVCFNWLLRRFNS